MLSSMASLPLQIVVKKKMLQALLVLFLYSASAAPANEIQALKSLGESLGTNLWNLTSDPCGGRWPGISCCLLAELNSPCCASIFYDPTTTTSSCTLSSINSTVVGVNLDATYYGNRMLTGFISDSICNLTSLVTLDLNNNFLRGQIPRCIGTSLTRLKKLGLSGGNLAGGFPAELGRLSSLQELYLDNNNLTGRIPSSVGGMTSLRMFYVRNNRLEGELPAELGELTNLVDITLQVNRFNGTLAPLASLTNLTSLRGFNNRFSGELTICQNLFSLRTLDLHLNYFTGSVPALNESFSDLEILDLSFNQLSGSIPVSVSRLPALTYLSLGHNTLNGSFPYGDQSFSSLQILDISHNSLTGPLPEFRNELFVGYAFNSFSLRTPGSSPSYFNCASSRNISVSCDRVQRRKQSLFGVRAGSVAEMRSREGFTFLRDVNSTDTGLYYLDGEGRWSVEVSGQSSGTLSAQSAIRVPPEYQDDPLLYQTMRWSSSYLAYHGTNLEDGAYNVTLYFCEMAFQNATFRAFDVRVQGETIEEQLDIAKLVGANTAYRITRNATVINGRLSIEFIYTGYDRYLERTLFRVNSTGAMVSAISVKPLNYVPPSSSSSSWWKATLAASAIAFVLAIISLVIIIRKRRSSKRRTVGLSRLSSWTRADRLGLKAFTYKELFKATNGFSSENKLGQGGFGSVYLGQLDEKLVAVKQLLHQTQQGRDSLRKEIEILSGVQHRNLVAIRGYCLEAEHPMLVFDYMQNGSLEGFLHGDSGFLTWKQRHSIAVDTAFGLAYLHDESTHKIIHCDMKPPNILLTDELHPRIADFGMARLYEEGRSHVTATKMGGTIGYLAPEYAMHYQLSDKADVYSFGVVLLELISGRRAVDSSKPVYQVVLVEYAQRLAMQSPQELAKLLDKRLESECEAQEVVNAGKVAVFCTLENPSQRPRMRDVWLMLRGTLEIPELPQIVDTKFSTVKALLSAYELPNSVANSQERLVSVNPR